MSILVEHEIALQPGVAVWQRYLDPKKDSGLRMEGDEVLEFPKLKEFEAVTVKATRMGADERTGRIVIRGGELVV